ncbi:MAG: hypothetical protein FWF80_01245, partial [Defluviitaleaceae bacterium]|nr:hypothetical protein [Defluviitaleaceae bacterium]
MSENDFKKLAQDYINKKGEEYLIELRELETSSPAEFDASRMDAKMNAALEALKTETSKETSKATSKNPRRKFLAMWGSIAACVAIGIFVAAYALNNPFMDEMTPMSADYSQILGAQEHFDFDFDFVYGDSLDRRSMAGEMPVTAEFELTDEAESVEVESPEAESVEATIETAVPEETVELPLSDDPPVFRSEALDDADYLRERLREHDDIWHDGDDEAADDMAYTGGSLG